MKKSYSKIDLIFRISIFLYFTIAAFYYLNRSEFAGGDESVFIRDLGLIHQIGWFSAIEKNISIPYMLLSYPLSYFFKFYLALRICNIILLFGFLYYLLRESHKDDMVFYFLFLVASTGFFFYGTNDALFFYSLSIFLIETQKKLSGIKFSKTLAISSLIIAAFTRELFFVYLPVILSAIYFLRKKDEVKNNLNIPIILFTTLIFFNIPSLIENGWLSYDKKLSPRTINATWTQRQYLAQLKVNRGELDFQSHPSWQETEDYLKVNGRNSLPKGIIEGLFLDIKLTIKEFFKDLFYILVYHVRLLGFILILTFLIAIKSFYRSKKMDFSLFTPIATSTMLCIFALIIISYVEMRWLSPVFILSIFYYDQLENRKMIPKQLSLVNTILMVTLSVYGSYGLIFRII
jgi:hypothetical protein